MEETMYWLVVAVTSRLENLARRRAVRHTWKNSLPSNVLFKFLLSDTSCNLHPMWKISSETCDHWQVNVPVWTSDSIPLVPFQLESLTQGHLPASGIFFQIKSFGLVVYRLGVLSHLLELNSELQLVLKNTKTGEIVEKIKFNSSEISGTDYTYKSVSNTRGLELLPSFEGWVYLSRPPGDLQHPRLCSVQDQHQLGKHGILYFTGMSMFDSTVRKAYTSNNCVLINFEYGINEPHDTLHHIAARDTQNQVEERRMRGVEADISEESEDHDDLVFVPSVDSQVAQAANIKNFLRQLEDIDYDYLLVTSDSSLVNIDLVLNHLSGDNTFWSSFQYSVKPAGIDLSYASNSFPPVPETSFVISKYLADFLANNAQYLKEFSSYEKSVGVWLSSLRPRYIHDTRWSANQDIKNSSEDWRKGKLISLQHLDPSQIISIWKE